MCHELEQRLSRRVENPVDVTWMTDPNGVGFQWQMVSIPSEPLIHDLSVQSLSLPK